MTPEVLEHPPRDDRTWRSRAWSRAASLLLAGALACIRAARREDSR